LAFGARFGRCAVVGSAGVFDRSVMALGADIGLAWRILRLGMAAQVPIDGTH
jgi:hypothetical protein